MPAQPQANSALEAVKSSFGKRRTPRGGRYSKSRRLMMIMRPLDYFAELTSAVTRNVLQSDTHLTQATLWIAAAVFQWNIAAVRFWYLLCSVICQLLKP